MDIKDYITCIVPARNEEKNLEYLIAQILQVDVINQIIIVEGASNDNTFEVAQAISAKNSKVELVKQSGKGKFNAVLIGVRKATNNYVLIWDADGTVTYDSVLKVIERRKSQSYLIVGDRLRGRRHPNSMQRANLIGNWFFAFLMATIYKRSVMDTLCGTKLFDKNSLLVLPKDLVELDPFGDFTIFLGAVSAKYEILSVPVEYRARIYGKTNIKRWESGFLLLRLAWKHFIFLRRKKNELH